MIIHLVPSLYAGPYTASCSLVDISIPVLGLHLRAGEDIVARRPFPNKNILVACRKDGTRATVGFLVEARPGIKGFTAITRWAIAAEYIATHQVKYSVVDHEHPLVSEYMVLWSHFSSANRTWNRRWPKGLHDGAPSQLQPQMEVRHSSCRAGKVTDTISNGLIIRREEEFLLPSIEKERLTDSLWDRLPVFEQAFRAPELQN